MTDKLNYFGVHLGVGNVIVALHTPTEPEHVKAIAWRPIATAMKPGDSIDPDSPPDYIGDDAVVISFADDSAIDRLIENLQVLKAGVQA